MPSEEITILLKNMPFLKSFCTTVETNLKLIIDALLKSQVQIQHFDLHKTQSLSLSSLQKLLELFPNVECLTLPLPKLLMTQLKWSLLISQCKFLVSLSFNDCHGYVVKGMLHPIADGCPSLQHIYLGYCEFSEDDIQYFLSKKKYQLWSFSSKFIYNGMLKHLSECTKLEYLYLENNNKNLSYNDIIPITKLRNLKNLTLQYCTEYIAESLPSFLLHSSFCKIVKLDFSHNFTIQDTDFSIVLKNFPFLRHLNLSSSHVLGDEGLCNIGSCIYLEYLNISMCSEMTDRSILYVSEGCKNLKHFNMSSCNNMTDNAIKHLFKCKKLQVLKFGFKSLKGIYFNLISIHWVQLTELHIDFCDSLEESIIDNLKLCMPQVKIMCPFYYEHGDREFKDMFFSVMN